MACGKDSTDVERIGRAESAVESSGLGVFYALAFEPAPSLATVSSRYAALPEQDQLAIFARELAFQGEPAWASGVITIPAVNGSGAPLYAPPPANNRIRYSCGATLVSPSYVVTAGHCVLDDSDLSAIRLRMYRPTSKLAESYVPALLTGTFPSYSVSKLSAEDGYLYDEYACAIESRCGSPDINCPLPGKDMALLRCQGRPGDKYGFVNVNRSGAPTGREALMHWKHEVLDLGAPESTLPQDRIDHYVMRTSDVAQNYHYFDDGPDLLPLRSSDWANGHPTKWVNGTGADTHGCHGSSGSGMLVRVGQTPVYELVGPVVYGGSSLGMRLCERVPNPGGNPSGEGTAALTTDGADLGVFLAPRSNDIGADCRVRSAAERDVTELPFAPGGHALATLFDHLSCQPDGFGADGTVVADARFGPYPEKFVETSDGTTHGIVGFSLERDADYRLGIQVMPRAACTSECGSITLSGGGSSFSTSPDPANPSVIAVAFPSPSAGPTNLAVANAGQLRALGGFVLIREGQVNSFDTLEDRLEAALYALDAEGAVRSGPLPMRFTGDGSAGFQALLLPGERLALLRQALVAGRRWTVRLGSPSYDGLTCGLLDESGAPLAATPCAELVRLDDREGTAARLGFYVELPNGGARSSAEVRYIALASDAARDDDGDGTPEVLDNCPNDWNAAQEACSEEPNPAGEGGAAGEGGESGSAGAAFEGGAAGESPESAGEGGAAGETTSNPNAGTAFGGGSGGPGGTGATGGTSGGGTGGGGVGGTSTIPAGGNSGSVGISGAGATGGGPEPGGESKRESKSDSGCGCRTAGEPRSSSSAWLALLLGAALIRRRALRTRPS